MFQVTVLNVDKDLIKHTPEHWRTAIKYSLNKKICTFDVRGYSSFHTAEAKFVPQRANTLTSNYFNFIDPKLSFKIEFSSIR